MSPQTRAALGLPASDLDPVHPPESPTAPPGSLVGLAVLLRVQRRLAIRTMAVLIIGLTAGPLALALAPGLDRIRIVGIPLVWLVLGAAVYPALWLLAAHHRRAVDRLDTALAERAGRGRR